MKYASNKTKLRFIKENKISEKIYISKLNQKLVKIIMSLRLNMMEIKENDHARYGDPICPLCHLETDTGEHLFKCEKLKEWSLDGQTHEDLRKNDHIVM